MYFEYDNTRRIVILWADGLPIGCMTLFEYEIYLGFRAAAELVITVADDLF